MAPKVNKDEDTSGKGSEQDSEDDDDELGDIDEEGAARLLGRAVKQDDDDEDDDDPEGADQLGDAGRRALERMKADRRAERDERKKLQAELDKVNSELRKHSDRDKSETQRLQEERDDLKNQLSKERSARQRREAAEEYAPDDADTKMIRAAADYISGETDEELEASAKKFYALFEGRGSGKKDVPGTPKVKLRGGGSSSDDDDEETDPRKLAEMIGRPR